MKAIIEFTLPDEQEEHRLAIDGSKWASVVHDMDEKLRAMAKYGEGSESANSLRAFLRETMADRGLSLE